MHPVIALMTDFGLKDGYVASMKGVILSICPRAVLVDVTHLIPPHDVRTGAYVLSTVYKDFPRGAIFLGVVDPGVGTERRGLVAHAGSRCFVGPDNGLFSLVLERESPWEAFALENPRFRRAVVSATFHGRDVFAPAVAHLANGAPLSLMGPPCRPESFSWNRPAREGDVLTGEVLTVDRFGNLVTNVTAACLEASGPLSECSVTVGEHRVPVTGRTYADAPPGGLLALMGSGDHLEISVNRGRADKMLKAGQRTSVRVESLRRERS